MGIFSRRARRNPSGEEQQDDRYEEARLAFEQGTRLFQQDRLREAAAAFATAVRLAPDSVNSQFFLGASLANARENEAAVAPLRRCLELDPDHVDGNNALGMVLGRLDQHDEADFYVAKAAFLGHPQAPQTLREMKMGYCRKCGGPVNRVDPSDADVSIFGPDVGMECTACPTVLCARCVLGDTESAVSPGCPDCGSTLIGFRVESEL